MLRAQPAAAEAARCPDENTLGAFVEGTLGEADARALEDHVDRCAGCYELIAEYARSHDRCASPTAGGSTDDATRVGALQRARPLPPGTRLGRYVVLSWIGEGSAGTVYAAYDPELDRRVAIKLLHPRSDEDPLATTLLREARAMAKLAHPEVVAVHDVGLFGGRVFVAMEFVHGQTLRAWCAGRRTVEEILAAYVAAGRGLAAAHSVGLVHRDFKPENVLVGDDGRVRVTDFGLALLDRTDAVTNPQAGTPAYMAPEQRRGDGVDERSDQYAFCVALDEALHRAPEPREGRIPSRIRRILTRGRSESPDARYPSMIALLAAIEADPRRRWTRALLGAAAVVTMGSLALVALGRTRAHEGPVCTGSERLLSSAWGDEQKRAVSLAFTATGKPYAADAWNRTEQTLDVYARDWATTRTDVCEATHVRGDQSSELLDVRMACLDDRLKELRALTALFAKADPEIVTNALGASASLGRVASCKDVRRLTAARPADPAKAATIDELRGQLAELKALDDAGKYKDALPQAARVADLAHSSGVRALEGEALFRQGDLLGHAGDLDAATSVLERASLAADAAGDDRTRAHALSALLFFVASEQAKFERIAQYREQAAAAIERLGGDDELRAELDHSLGAALSSQGALEQAQPIEEESLALAEKLYGTESREAAYAMSNLGLTCLFRGATDRAVDLLSRALAIASTVLGPHHPQVGNTSNNYGLALAEKDDNVGAEHAFRQALVIFEDSLGPDHPRVALALQGVAGILIDQSDYAGAIPLLERARLILEKHLRPDHPSLFYVHRSLGQAYLGLHKPADAIAHLELAVALHAGAGDSDVADAQFSLAQAMRLAGRAAPMALAQGARDSLAAHVTGPGEERRLAEMDAWLATQRDRR